MKMKCIKLMVLAAILSPMLFSCSGGAGSSGTSLFGSLPGVYSQYQAEKDKLQEEAKSIKSEADKAKLIEKSQKMEEDWSGKIEKSAIALDGKEINLTDSIIKVSAPLSLTFEQLSGRDLEPRFKINGAAETIEALTIEKTYSTSRIVYLVGYDAAGNELFKSEVGSVNGNLNDTTLEIPAGTQVEFDTLKFNDKYVEKYPEAKTLKLIIKTA